MMPCTLRDWSLRWLLVLSLAQGPVSCFSASLGRPFAIDPRSDIKLGHDRKQDVLRKMGQPYRRSVDSLGHEIFVYVWADGDGAGNKCIIAFNKNDVVYVVDVAP